MRRGVKLRSNGRKPRGRRGFRLRGDDGAATIEFVFLGILMMVPLVYVILAVFDVQRNGYGVTQAAREAGRAFATAETAEQGMQRARFAVTMALQDQQLDAEHTILRFVDENSGCNSGPAAPDMGAASLQPGADFAVCVVRTYVMPGVPTILDGRNNTVTGKFIVHVDDYRSRT